MRAMYMYSAMADLAAELDDDSLKRACEALWEDVTGKRMYVTAGLGPPRRTKASPRTTTCRTTPPMPRPAPRLR